MVADGTGAVLLEVMLAAISSFNDGVPLTDAFASLAGDGAAGGGTSVMLLSVAGWVGKDGTFNVLLDGAGYGGLVKFDELSWVELALACG